MREFIAVNDPFSLLNMPLIKREAIMFSRIAIPKLDEAFSGARQLDEIRPLVAEMDWLCENGILFEPRLAAKRTVLNEEYQKHLDSLRSQAKEIISLLIGFDFDEIVQARGNLTKTAEVKTKLDALAIKDLDAFKELFESQQLLEASVTGSEYLTRMHSIELRELHNLDAFPVIHNSIQPTIETEACRGNVVDIVFKALPIPDEATSWEQIVEYRADPDSRSKFLALRNWMNKMARSQLPGIEVEQELEYLADQYQQHLSLHRMKTDVGSLEAIVMVGAEFIENLSTMKWSQVAKRMFEARHRKIALLEHELTSPGRELAYVMKAKDSFPTA